MIGQFFTLQAIAQWSSDPKVNNVIIADTSQQSACRITSDGSGGAIITWWNYSLTTNKYDIYAQRINSAGIIQWADNGVAICTNPSHQQNPEMASDGKGGAIITWFDQRNIKNEIFAQKIDSDGVVQWTVDGVTVGAVAENFQQGSPVVINDGNGGAIIAWEDWRGDISNAIRSIHAQKISPEGNIQWGIGGVSLNDSSGGESPKIISDGNGGAIVAWHQWDGVYPAGDINIYAQKVNANGSVLWAHEGVEICTLTSDQRNVQLVSDGNGGAIIAWEDRRGESFTNIYAQKVNAEGVIQWTPDGIPVSPTPISDLNQIRQRLLSDGSGGAFVTWQYSSNLVCTQRINSSGVYQWDSYGVEMSNRNAQMIPQITTDGGTGAIITWFTFDTDIYAQRIDSAGTILWGASGASISTNPSGQGAPQIVSNGTGGAIIVWDDDRNFATNSMDIYAQRINGDGTLGLETGMNEKENFLPAGFTLDQNYPNPFVTETLIGFKVAVPCFVSLKVFNIEGKEVSTIINEEMDPGIYSVMFKATGLPGGVYYYRMKAGNENDTRVMILVK